MNGWYFRPVSGILLGLGLLCLYIEFKTPGFGVPGLVGVAFLAVWFWGHHVAGLQGNGRRQLASPQMRLAHSKGRICRLMEFV